MDFILFYISNFTHMESFQRELQIETSYKHRCLITYNENRVSFSRAKRPGRGLDHPHPSRAEAKERVELYFTPPQSLRIM